MCMAPGPVDGQVRTDQLSRSRTQLFILRRNDDVTYMAASDRQRTILININFDGHRTSPVAGQPARISDAPEDRR